MTPEIRYMYMYIVYTCVCTNVCPCTAYHDCACTFTQVNVQRKIVCAVWQNTSSGKHAHHRHTCTCIYFVHVHIHVSATMTSYTSIIYI